MANIKVSQSDWNSISDAEKKAIQDGLTKAGTLRPGDTIVGDPASTTVTPQWDPVGDLCRIGCDVAAGAGAAWCTANTAGAGLAVCLAAAEAVRQECRRHC